MRFLSAEWFAEADRLARTTAPATGLVPPTTIEYRVETGDDDVRYQFVITAEGSRVIPAPAPTAPPDAVLTLTYETAAAISSGELQAYEAIRRGLVKVSGRANALVACQAELRRVNESLRPLAARTRY